MFASGTFACLRATRVRNVILGCAIFVGIACIGNFAHPYPFTTRLVSCDNAPPLSPPEECSIMHPDFPSYLALLSRKPRIGIFLHDPEEDKWISSSVLHSNGGHSGIVFEKGYTLEFLSLLRNSSSPLMVDVGANIGLHSLYLAAQGMEVHAFEAHPANSHLLECSMWLNRELVAHNLHLNKVALGEQPGSLCMTHSKDNRGGSFGVLCNDTRVEAVVPIQTLDSYWENVLHRRRITVLKIDVEGFEVVVLKGAKKMFASAPPSTIHAEWGLKNDVAPASPYELFDMLVSRYRIYWCHAWIEDEITDTYRERFNEAQRRGAADIRFYLR